MADAVLIAAVFAAELLIWYVIGTLLPMGDTPEEHSFCENVCGGCILNMALIEAAASAATLFECPLTVFSRIWAVVLSALCAVAIVFRGGENIEGIRTRMKENALNFAAFFAALAAVLFALLAVVLPVVPDSGLIIGQMTQDLYHDSIGLYEPGTGARLHEMAPEALFARYYVNDLFYAQISGIHPMAVMRIIRTALMALVSSMAVYRILCRFFGRNRTKAGIGLILYLVISLFFQRSYTVSGLLLSSGWTGNAAFAAVVMPVFLLLVISLYERPDSAKLHALTFAAGAAAVSCSAQAIFVYPFAALAGFVPLAVHAKDRTYIPRILLWIAVPAAAAFLCLFLPQVVL